MPAVKPRAYRIALMIANASLAGERSGPSSTRADGRGMAF
jgi:hypothetical protein